MLAQCSGISHLVTTRPHKRIAESESKLMEGTRYNQNILQKSGGQVAELEAPT